MAMGAAPAVDEVGGRAWAGVMPAALISAAGGLSGSLHFVQMMRTNRWARMATMLDATRNGATPMSCRRVIALGASLVWSVLKTMCPVRDACTAISAVS